MKKLMTLVTLVGLTSTTGILAHAPAHTQVVPHNTSRAGFYLGARGGVDLDFNRGFALGAQAGYRWDNGFRIEEAFSYIQRNSRSSTAPDDIRTTWMTNAYYDFNTGTPWTPYLGTGIGYAHTNAFFANGFTNGEGGFSSWAIQGIAGLGYQINPHFGIDVQYRLLELSGRGTSSDIIEAGLNYYFST